MKYNELIGKIVYSKAGRDQGRMFIIFNVIDDDYVSIVDGDLRTVEKPKKKKIKHLYITNEVMEDVKERIISNNSISNIKVRRFLKNRDAIKEG
ncbi:KOW domain-containing RNA-binding protein [Clostridium massiliodielmoense]|uniref:KOW domain-containing RNA-binding protein n=1 Tax=Clostridium massiliodielmoense TaxID=1776385 RepID=UPI000A26F56B|nr:KOW domain-containing RNA-binding protein [Clostridium massiliodielmoense]